MSEDPLPLEQRLRETAIARRELEAENERLREADQRKDERIATVVHELRAPLTSIRSFAEILRDDPQLPEEQRSAFLGLVVSECERVVRLIDQMLDPSKIETGRMEWNVGDVAIEGIVRAATLSLMPIFERDGVKIAVETLDADLPPVRVDRDRVIQVLVNLVCNAEKFCRKPGGTVVVGVRRDGVMARFSVIDDGPGIAEGERAHIFEWFYRVQGAADASSKVPATGAGLGLAISKRIVSELGGRIWVEAREDGNEGSAFYFTVPLSEPTPAFVHAPGEV